MAKKRGPDWAPQVMREAAILALMTPVQSAAHAAAQDLINRYERECSRRGWELTREIAAERLRDLRGVLAVHSDMVSVTKADIGACIDELEEVFPDLKL